MQSSCNPIFPGRQVRLTSTAKPITPFGGLVSLIAFFEKIGLAGQISGLMPFTYNLLSLYQHASAPEPRKAGFKRPATLRAAVFIGGALLGNRSRTPVLYIAQSWGGLEKHKPLLDNISQWPGATSPKLPPEPPRDETAGGGPEQKHCAA